MGEHSKLEELKKRLQEIPADKWDEYISKTGYEVPPQYLERLKEYEGKEIPDQLLKKAMKKGIKKEKYKDKIQESSERIHLHPTNKFFQVLINKRIENNLDMIVSITKLPIYSSSNNDIMFLFGEANIDHRCSIVSTLLLKEQFYKRKRDKPLYELRIIKEVIHEVGHLILGPSHCINKKCVMSFSQNVKDIDAKYIGLCQDCQKKLETLKYSYNF